MHKLYVCYFTYSTEYILLVRGNYCVGNCLRSDLNRLADYLNVRKVTLRGV